MKIKDGFILRVVAKQNVVLPAEGDLELSKMMVVNSTGKFLWEQLEQEITKEELIRRVLTRYDIDEKTASTCVEQFTERLEKHGFLV